MANYFETFPQEKFALVNENKPLRDKELITKPRGFFADAMFRFSRNKGSIVAAVIIGILFLALHHAGAAEGKEPQAIISLTFFEAYEPRAKAETELIYLYASALCHNEMSEFMKKDNESEDQYCYYYCHK
jgi:hypothetical protein